MLKESPGAILSGFIRNYGCDEFTVEPIDPETGVPYGSADLGNGNHIYNFVSQMTDSVTCSPGEEIDMAACNFGDWDNLSRFYTGQYGAPNSMHDSEYVGGRLAEDMARVPGEYAIPYITWDCDSECECGGDSVLPAGAYCDLLIEGWLVLYRDIFDTEESH